MFGKLRVRSVFALCASSLAVGACAVYDGSLLSADLEQGSSGGNATAGTSQTDGSGGDGGLVSGNAGASSGGTPSTAGDEASVAGDAGEIDSGGASPTAGASAGGNAGSSALAGSGGALGSAGNSGTGGALEGGAGASGGAPAGGAPAGGAPSGGSGGAVGVVSCADHPLSAKSTWTASASHQSTTPKNPPSCLIDGANTRWSSGKAQSGDEWVQIDFGATVSLRGINLQQGADTNDYPRSYAVIVSDTKNDLTGTVRVSGAGTSGVTTTITLPKVSSGRYLLIKQIGSSLSWWSVAEVEPSCTD